MSGEMNLPPVYEITGGPYQGGMGRVYRVQHRDWNVPLAVKQPLPGLMDNPQIRDGFMRECELWVSLGLHENIVFCYYARNIDGALAVFSEWMDGGSLKDKIASRSLYDGAESDTLRVQLGILDIAIQIARGMAYAHDKNLAHRDLKPGNVMFSADGTAKITDFGLAVLRNRDGDDQWRGYGTLAYASPEQQEGKAPSVSADIWSFGVILLEMFLGGRNWKNSAHIVSRLDEYITRSRIPAPEGIRELIKQCCSMQLIQRPANFHEIEEKLLSCYRSFSGKDYFRKDMGGVYLTADSWNNRALSYMDLGKTGEAEKCWEKAIRADPVHMPSLFNLTLYQWRRAAIDDVTAAHRLQNAYNAAPRRESAELLARFFMEARHSDAVRKLNALYEKPLADVSELVKEDLHGAFMPKRAIKTVAAGENTLFLFQDGTAEIWDMTRKNFLRLLPVGHVRMNDAVSDPDGHMIAIACDEGLLLFDGDGRRRAFFRIPEGRVKRVFLCHENREAVIYALRREGEIRKQYYMIISLLDGHWSEKIRFQGMNSDIFFPLHDGEQFILADSSALTLFDFRTGKVLRVFSEAEGDIVSAALSADETRLAAHDGSGVFVWRVSDGALESWFKTEPCGEISFARDGKLLLTAGARRNIKLWEIDSGRCLRTFSPHSGPTRSLLILDDGEAFLSVGEDDGVFYQRVPAFREKARWKFCRTEESRKLRKDRIAFETLLREAAELWKNQETAKALRTLYRARSIPGYERHPAYLRLNAAIGRNLKAKSLLSAWSAHVAASGTGLEKFSNPLVSVGNADKWVLTAQYDGDIIVTDAESGNTLRTMRVNIGGISSATLSPDGRRIALGCFDGGIALCSFGTGSVIWKKKSRENMVTRLAFCPRNSFLLAGYADGIIMLYDTNDGRALSALSGHTKAVTYLEYLSDGLTARSKAEDGETRTWRLDYQYAPERKCET